MTRLTQLTERDLMILKALSLQVRLFGQRQLAESLWSGEIANARRRLRRFVELGLVKRKVALARPLPEMLSPVFQWMPGRAEPDVGQIAFQLQSRWRYQALRSTIVFVPTPTILNHFGGRQKTLMSSQASHDLGVSEVWLWYLRNRPALAAAWRGEDLLIENEPGESLPDAVLVDANEQPVMLIEFGGDYNANRIATFHDAAAMRGIPYQVW